MRSVRDKIRNRRGIYGEGRYFISLSPWRHIYIGFAHSTMRGRVGHIPQIRWMTDLSEKRNLPITHCLVESLSNMLSALAVMYVWIRPAWPNTRSLSLVYPLVRSSSQETIKAACEMTGKWDKERHDSPETSTDWEIRDQRMICFRPNHWLIIYTEKFNLEYSPRLELGWYI